MKTTKFFAILALLICFTIGAFAQNTANEDLTATALVLTAMKVEKISDLDFGSVAQGTDKSVALDGTVSGYTSQGTETVGLFKVTADATASVIYELTTPSFLLNGEDELPILFVAEYLTFEEYQSGATAVQNVGTTIEMPVGNILYFFIGGTVDADDATPPPAGEYSNTVNLAVTYE